MLEVKRYARKRTYHGCLVRIEKSMPNYHNDPKFSDRYAWANRSSLNRVYTVCYSICIVWTRYSIVAPHSSNFRVIRTNFSGVRIFRKFKAEHPRTASQPPPTLKPRENLAFTKTQYSEAAAFGQPYGCFYI